MFQNHFLFSLASGLIGTCFDFALSVNLDLTVGPQSAVNLASLDVDSDNSLHPKAVPSRSL